MRRLVTIATVVIAVAVVGVIVGVLRQRARTSSTAALVDLGRRPASYRVLYRVESLASPPFIARWEVLTVRRPFESRDVTYEQRPTGPGAPGGRGNLATVDHLYLVGDAQHSDRVQQVSGRQPGVPTGDQALATEVAEAQRRGLARVGGRRVIAGRSCRDVRFLEPVAGPIKALTGADHDLICIDRQGIVVREEWVLAGRVVQRKEAVEVIVDPPNIDGAFDVSAALPAPGAAAPTVLAPPVGRDDPPAPAGFRLATVVSFQLPAPQQLGSGPADLLYASTVWAWVRGPDVITVEEGTSTDDALPWNASDPSRSLSLPAGRATSVVRSDGPEIRVALGRRHWMRVRGTVGLSTLTAYARRLSAP